MRTTIFILILIISVLISLDLLPAQWLQQNSGTTQSLTDVVMLDSTTAIAVGRSGLILKTTDCGSTWISPPIPATFVQPWNDVDFCDSLNGVVIGDYGVPLTTSDGGNSWRCLYIPSAQKYFSVLQLSPGHFYIGADSGWVYQTADTGKTWTSEKISTDPICALFEWRGDYLLGLPIYALTPHSLFSKIEFPSSPWAETALPFDGLGSEAFSGEFCFDGGAGFIVGVFGDYVDTPAILRKTMSDTTWQIVTTGIDDTGTLLGVSAPSAEVIYVCGTDGMIYKSTDSGDTWTASATPTTQDLNAIYFYDKNHGFAVGDSGVILHTSNGGLSGIDNQENQLPLKFVLKQNYPNPFNQSTTISFSIPARLFVSLKVFDIAGREVSSLVSEELSAGENSRQWNAAGFSSGVYLYRLQSGSSAVTRKLVLLK